MKKILFIYFVLLSSSLFAQTQARFIDVTGTAEIIAQADHVHFLIEIKNVSDTLEVSRRNNLAASDGLVRTMKEFKIEKGDWEISPVKFGKEYEYRQEGRKFAGYYSQLTVSVKLRNLTDYYSFTTEISKNKNYEITQSEYGLSDMVKYNKQALLKAAQDAREKAEYIAESMNVKIGKINEIKEMNRFEAFPTPLNSTMNGAANATDNVSGKITITRSVNMKIELAD
jgi:uncharacterized protein YggE